MLLQQTRLAPGEDREVLRRLDEAIPLLDTVDLEGGPDVPASAPGPGEIFERLLETGDSPVNGRDLGAAGVRIFSSYHQGGSLIGCREVARPQVAADERARRDGGETACSVFAGDDGSKPVKLLRDLRGERLGFPAVTAGIVDPLPVLLRGILDRAGAPAFKGFPGLFPQQEPADNQQDDDDCSASDKPACDGSVLGHIRCVEDSRGPPSA